MASAPPQPLAWIVAGTIMDAIVALSIRTARGPGRTLEVCIAPFLYAVAAKQLLASIVAGTVMDAIVALSIRTARGSRRALEVCIAPFLHTVAAKKLLAIGALIIFVVVVGLCLPLQQTTLGSLWHGLLSQFGHQLHMTR